MTVRPFYVAGEWRTGEGTLEVRSPYDQSVVAEVGVPTDADVEEAVSTAAETFAASRLLTTNERAEALVHVSRRIGERVDEFAESIAREGGKPLKWSRSRRRARSRRSDGRQRRCGARAASSSAWTPTRGCRAAP